MTRFVIIAVNVILMTGMCLLFAWLYGFSCRFIIYTVLTANLLYISNRDIRERAVSFEAIAVSAACGLAVLLFNKDNNWWNYILSGIGFAVFFILISRITKNAIGAGDALIIGVIGLFLGFYHTLSVIFFGLSLGGIAALALVAAKKVSRNTPLPFAPFLTAGFLVSILI